MSTLLNFDLSFINSSLSVITQQATEPLLSMDEGLLNGTFFTLANTTVVILVLGFILYNPVRKFLAAREQRIADQIDSTNKANEDAHQLKKQYESKMKDIEIEREAILIKARKVASDMENKIVGEARDEYAQILKRANVEVELEKAKASDEIKLQIIEVSTLVAKKYVSEEINKDTQNKLVDKIIGDLGDVEWSN